MRSARDLRRDAAMYASRRLVRSLAPPDRVSLNLTLRCNLTCAMCTTCYDAPELSTDEVKGIIDQTAAWGVEVFNPLGGEPFMRADIVEILDYAVRRGFYVTVTTNGTLITERRAQALSAVPTDRLHLIFSIDGGEAEHDRVRGAGTWQRAMAGYDRVRRADADAGHSRRKILANSLLHRGNLDGFEDALDLLAGRGFDGVQVLNLFRDEAEDRARAHGMWFEPGDLARLDAVAERLARRAESQGTAGFAIQNTPDELRMARRYYEGGLRPLDAPCWAGWKELYVNADGTAIMCDGKLDFLAGAFGNVREQTLQELWRSPALAERRRVVKTCTTPCAQTCYLRGESDTGRAIAADAGRLVGRAVVDRVRRTVDRVEHRPDAVLRLELTDVCPCDWEGCETPPERWRTLIEDAVEPPRADNWTFLRDRGHVDFGRGFMGFEVVRSVVGDLLSARLRFGTLALRWRGEPLLHPEVEPILRYLLDSVHRHGLADRVRIETDGVFLTPAVAALAAHPADQEWVIDLDRGGAGLALLQAGRGAHTRLVLATTAVAGLSAPIMPGFSPSAGRFPEAGDALWIRRADHDHFQANAEARRQLVRIADDLGIPADPGDESRPRRCGAPWDSPTVSWDGKITLCPWDRRLDNRVGEVTAGRLSEVWRGAVVARHRRSVEQKGVPERPLCRDCAAPWSPNGVVAPS